MRLKYNEKVPVERLLKLGFIGRGMHIHPALPELILRKLGSLREPSP